MPDYWISVQGGTPEQGFCAGPGAAFQRSDPITADYPPIHQTPITDIFSVVSGGAGLPIAEFMYLESNVNKLKGIFWKLNRPVWTGPERTLERNLGGLGQIALVADYLQRPDVAQVYRAVSGRLRARFVAFQHACRRNNTEEYAAFGAVDMGAAWDEWARGYVGGIQGNMRAAVDQGFGNVTTQIAVKIAASGSDAALRMKLVRLRDVLLPALRSTKLSDAQIGLGGLL